MGDDMKKKFSNENAQTLGAPVQDLVVTVTWHSGFLHTYVERRSPLHPFYGI